jgi:hypothetical protein
MLPHITNSQAGVNRWDYTPSNIFEVYFTLPEALRADFGQDEAIITEHVQKIDGLDAIHKTAELVEQKFMGTTRSFIKGSIDNTSADLTVDFALNLRNGTDNFIYRLFKAWSKLGYDINTGERSLKQDYLADWLRVKIANRAGDVYEDVIFKDVMLAGPVEGVGSYDYNSDDVLTLSVKFRSDWWSDTDAA